MPISKTLAEFRRAAVYEAGVGGAVGDGSTFRHPNEDLTPEINSVYQSFREELTTRDFEFFIEETEQQSIPTDRADDNEQYSLIDWPTNALQIKRIDTYAQGRWESLVPIDWSRVRDVLSSGVAASPYFRPRWYSVKNFGATNSFEGVDGTEYEVVAGKIALIPFATGGGTYKMSVLPVFPAALDDDELFIFPNEVGFRWCVYEAVTRIAVRDRNAGKRYDYAQQQRTLCEQKIGRFVPRVINTGGATMRRAARYNG